ncbi:MAG: aspartate/glutamate racemase family protein, partial [Deltaproteobacteria bacterium]
LLTLVALLAASPAWAAPPGIGVSPLSSKVAAPEPTRKALTIGIIGGVSWVSSLEYYRLMNQMVRDRLGPLHSANILMYSIEFGTFSEQERLAEAGDWRPLRETMRDAARRLKAGGADFIVIASNTMNSSADDIEKNVGIPVLRIMDPTARKIGERGLKKVALLGTKYTMENPFWRDHVKARYGIEVVTPTLAEREDINRIIFDELCADVVKEESRKRFLQIIDRMVQEEKAEGVVLGCTEIPMLVKQADVGVPVFDTTVIHSEAAVNRSLGERR